MKLLIQIALVISFLAQPIQCEISQLFKTALEIVYNSSSIDSFQSLINQGEMVDNASICQNITTLLQKSFFSAEQVWYFYDYVKEHSPNLYAHEEVIATTIQQASVKLICLSDKTTGDIDKKDIALLVSAHHSRELLSVSMGIFTAVKLIQGFNNKNTEVINLLKENQVCFVPILNVDGYNRIQRDFRAGKGLIQYRKNGRSAGCQRGELFDGVDLNRNYDYHWGIERDSSSNDPCDEQYRGSSPFSEPETKGIKDFVEKHKSQIKIAINFHAYGNLWIHPFNCCPNDNSMSAKFKNIYADLRQNGKFPEKAQIGNAYSTIHYLADGEASDWYLGKHGILSMSPELGTMNPKTDGFFINEEYILPTLQKDINPIWYMIFKLTPDMEEIHIQSKNETNFSSLKKSFRNKSYKLIQNVTLDLSVHRKENSIEDVPQLQIDISGKVTPCLASKVDIEGESFAYTCNFDLDSWEIMQITLPSSKNGSNITSYELKIEKNSKSIMNVFTNSFTNVTKIQESKLKEYWPFILLVSVLIFFYIIYLKTDGPEEYSKVRELEFSRVNSGSNPEDIETVQMDNNFEV